MEASKLRSGAEKEHIKKTLEISQKLENKTQSFSFKTKRIIFNSIGGSTLDYFEDDCYKVKKAVDMLNNHNKSENKLIYKYYDENVKGCYVNVFW